MPKILWMSPYSLHDTSSGASVNAKDMFENLVKRGWEVWSCSSFVFNDEAGTTFFGDINQKLHDDQHQVFVLDDSGIHYVYTRCHSISEMDFTLEEGQLFYETFCSILDEFQPDIVFGYCPSMTSMACFAEAKRRGISNVYLVVNGNHSHFSFPHFDLVTTDSQATSNRYAESDRINVVPTGAFFKPERFLCSGERHPSYITLVNPAFEKGLAIFAKIAKVCQEELPDLKFLVVNNHGSFVQNVAALHSKDNPAEHPFSGADFPNVSMAAPLKNMCPLYDLVKVLIVPSLGYESWGRIVSEGVLNQIPVIATNSGGIAEALCGAGILLDAPQHCKDDFLSIPTDEEIRPWIDALKQALTADYSKEVAAARETLDIEKATDKLVDALLPLYEIPRGNSPKFYFR